MLRYNTQQKPLVLPEYGRNIQKMVDYCLTIEDRDERNHCARSIVATMANFYPQLKNSEEFIKKLWDHLAIMADFKLDIDFPFDPPKRENFQQTPDKIAYPSEEIKYRHYGKSVVAMIDHAVAMEASEEKDALVMLIANHMKKLMLAVNKEGVDDAKIFKDLAELSHGNIILKEDQVKLHEFIAAPTPQTGKKKKKK